jgi:DNA-binding beta-propeller fold protein YncE
VIGEDDLKNLIDDDPAYEILQARRNWVRDQLDALEMAHGEEAAWLNWGYEGTGNGQFEKPQGVAIDSSGNVYVADSNNNRIQKFDSWGDVIDVWGGPEDGQFEKPQGVAVDSSGNVYVVDTDNHRIQKFDSDGRLLKQWGEEGSEKGEFKRPSGVAVDVNSGDVYVADTKNHRIQKFDSDGGFIREWGEEGNRKGAFKNPRGVAVDSSGKVYVADTENHRIQKFNPDGNPIAVLGQEEGNGEGEFSWPLGVAVDSSGNVYVADSNNHRIQKFDSDGRFLMQWGRQGSEDGQFKTPSGVAVDRSSGNVYVADTYNNRIHACIFNLTVLKFRAIISSAVGISLKDLMDLAEERKQGNDISARLDQLSLSMTAFLYLLRIHDLLVSDAEIMDSEWDDVYSILVQVQKRRIFAEWRDDEREKGIILSSDFFVISEEEPEELHPWRASWEARRDWQDKLGSRIGQEKTVCAAMAEAVDACEEATLTLLRDGLVEASDAEGNDITAKAKRLTEQLLIDCQIDACQKTTRISQAIITLQKLIFSLRTGQLEDSELEFDPGENFEDEWMWVGSYETWKAAVGVFLYPENILLPGLRRQQTPAFQELIEKIRQNRRLTPQKAIDLAKEYETYLKEICSLDAKAVVQTSSRVYVIAQVFFKSLYISSYDLEDTSGDTQTFWEKIDGLENVVVKSVVGATPYEIRQERYIYLFLKIKKDSKDELVFIKYNLDSGKWDSEPKDLELPTGIKRFSAVVKQGYGEINPPHLAIKSSGRLSDIYARKIDDDDWEEGNWDDDFKIEEGDNIPYNNDSTLELVSMVDYDRDVYVIIWEDAKIPPRRKYKIIGKHEISGFTEWKTLPDGYGIVSLLFKNRIINKIILLWSENDIIYYENILDPEGRKYEFPDTDIRIYSMTSHHDYAKDSDRVIDIICNLKDQGYTGDYPYRSIFRWVFRLKNDEQLEGIEFERITPFLFLESPNDIILEPTYLRENGQQLTQDLFGYYLDNGATSPGLT